MKPVERTAEQNVNDELDFIVDGLDEDVPYAKRILHTRPANWEIIAEEAEIYGNYILYIKDVCICICKCHINRSDEAFKYDCRRRTVLRGIVLRHTVLANFFGTIAGGASGLSRIGTLVEGHPDGFYVTGLYVSSPIPS